MPIGIPLLAAGIGAAGSAYAANQASKGQKQSAQASQQATDYATGEQRRQYDLSRADNAPWLRTGQGALAQLGALYGIGGQQGGVSQPMMQPTGDQGFGGQMAGYARAMGPMGEMQRLDGNSDMGMVGTGQYGGAQAVPDAGNQAGGGVSTGQPGSPMAGFFQSPDYQFRLNESMRGLTARNAALGIQDSGAAQRSALTLAGNQASGEFNNYANRLAALAGVGQTAAGQNQTLGQNFAGAVGDIARNNAQNLSSSYQNQATVNGQLGQQFAGIGAGLLMNNQKYLGGLFK